MKAKELLRDKRLATGLSQLEFGMAVGLGQSYVSGLEVGRIGITADTLLKYRQVVPITDDDALFLLGLKEAE